MRFLQGQANQIVEALRLNQDDQVLDIAAGTGEPGLTIASVVHQGSVMAIDLSESMLQIAEEKARHKGLTNYSTQSADVCELPFADATFDAVSCRLGFMFFPDLDLAAREIYRVLKPGGRVATTVWGEPGKNLWVTALMGSIKRNVDMPTPPPGAPGMFRCATPGFVSALFKGAGFSEAGERAINGVMSCTSTDEYWAFMNEVVPPVVAVFRDATETTKNKIRREVYDLLEERLPGTRKDIGFGARLITATKPY